MCHVLKYADVQITRNHKWLLNQKKIRRVKLKVCKWRHQFERVLKASRWRHDMKGYCKRVMVEHINISLVYTIKKQLLYRVHISGIHIIEIYSRHDAQTFLRSCIYFTISFLCYNVSRFRWIYPYLFIVSLLISWILSFLLFMLLFAIYCHIQCSISRREGK